MKLTATISLCLLCASALAAELVPVPLRPVTFEDSVDLQTWDVVVDNCTNLTFTVLPVGNHFFRARLEIVDARCTIIVPFNVDGLWIWNGPESGSALTNTYTQLFDVPLSLPHMATNQFIIRGLRVYPTNHLAAQCYVWPQISDMSPEIETVFTNFLNISN